MNIFIFYNFLIFHFFKIAFEKEFVILVKVDIKKREQRNKVKKGIFKANIKILWSQVFFETLLTIEDAMETLLKKIKKKNQSS